MPEETTIYYVQHEALYLGLCTGGDHYICVLLSVLQEQKRLCSKYTCNNVSLESVNILSGSETLNILCETG